MQCYKTIKTYKVNGILQHLTLANLRGEIQRASPEDQKPLTASPNMKLERLRQNSKVGGRTRSKLLGKVGGPIFYSL